MYSREVLFYHVYGASFIRFSRTYALTHLVHDGGEEFMVGCAVPLVV